MKCLVLALALVFGLKAQAAADGSTVASAVAPVETPRASCPAKLEGPKPRATQRKDRLSLYYLTVADTPRFANDLVEIALTVRKRYAADTLRTVRSFLGRHSHPQELGLHTADVDDFVVIYLHLYGYDLRSLSKQLPRVQFDLDLKDKIRLGLNRGLPNRDENQKLWIFNWRILDQLTRMERAKFEVRVSIRDADAKTLKSVAKKITNEDEFRGLTILNPNVGDKNQSMIVVGSGESILELQHIRAIVSVERIHHRLPI